MAESGCIGNGFAQYSHGNLCEVEILLHTHTATFCCMCNKRLEWACLRLHQLAITSGDNGRIIFVLKPVGFTRFGLEMSVLRAACLAIVGFFGSPDEAIEPAGSCQPPMKAPWLAL